MESQALLVPIYTPNYKCWRTENIYLIKIHSTDKKFLYNFHFDSSIMSFGAETLININ